MVMHIRALHRLHAMLHATACGGCLLCWLSLQGMSQGNEFSYYMLLGSAFMLNHTAATEQWTIYPWALASCNQLSDAEQLRPVGALPT